MAFFMQQDNGLYEPYMAISGVSSAGIKNGKKTDEIGGTNLFEIIAYNPR